MKFTFTKFYSKSIKFILSTTCKHTAVIVAHAFHFKFRFFEIIWLFQLIYELFENNREIKQKTMFLTCNNPKIPFISKERLKK